MENCLKVIRIKISSIKKISLYFNKLSDFSGAIMAKLVYSNDLPNHSDKQTAYKLLLPTDLTTMQSVTPHLIYVMLNGLMLNPSANHLWCSSK
jgi:hypothetical protein